MAACYASVLAECGFLADDRLVELDVSRLPVSSEQAAEKLEQMWKQAQGSAFYLLHPQLLSERGLAERLFALIEETVKADHPQTAILFAGPELPLRCWLESGPPWLERMGDPFIFHEYSTEEMALFFERLAREEDYVVHPAAWSALLNEMRSIRQTDTGRSMAERVREYFRRVKVKHGLRCARLPKEERTQEALTLIVEEDLLPEKSGMQPGDPEWLAELEKRH
jgi:hypothetical protein